MALSMKNFFKQIISDFKEKKVRNLAVITDKDGTLLLNYDLRKALQDLRGSTSDVRLWIIVNSGRTVR